MKVVWAKLLVVVLAMPAAGDDAYEAWSRAGESWHERWMNLAKQSEALPPEERIKLLSPAMKVGSNRVLTEEQEEVYNVTKEMLLNSPGHAEYHAREINEARERYDAALAEGLPGRAGPALNDLYNIQSAGFGTLRHLPSPETVRVLGEFLYDERGKRTSPRVPGDEERGEFPNCGFAVNALHALPLVNKPVKAERLAPGDLETYRLWYEQIKAGNRTFRFEGDPREYSLDGPVSVAAPFVDARRSRPSEASAAAEVKADETSRLPMTALVLTTLLLAGAFAYFIRNRRQHA